MVKYWIKKSLEILKQCSSNLAPQKRPNDTHSVVAKETLLGPVSKFSTLLSGTEGPAWNWHGFHMVSTLTVRLVGAYSPWLRQKLGISVLIRQDQQQNGCYANSTTGVILLLFCDEHFQALKLHPAGRQCDWKLRWPQNGRSRLLQSPQNFLVKNFSFLQKPQKHD